MSNETWDKFKSGFRDAYSEGRDDFSEAYYAGRDLSKKDRNASRMSHMLGTNPTLVRMREALGMANPDQVEARRQMGMGLKKDRTERIGQMLGTVANDLTQDHSRSIYWLLNAPQATGNVINEEILNRVNPDLFGAENAKNRHGEDIKTVRMDKSGEPIQDAHYQHAIDNDLIDRETGRRKKGVGTRKGVYTRRLYDPGDVASLGIAPGIAINAGIGLLNPFGGANGYEAVIPSDEDPTKTANMLLEVGTKYILGQTGKMLPYNQFKEYRPDVSKGEYQAYKAFKYNKALDLDITDGDFTLPTGVVKGTTDGIHGPEIQFLGRSLPLLTTGIPFAAAVAGTALGARKGNRRPIQQGLLGGMAGLTAGGATGLLLEAERQRRNGAAYSGALDPEEAQVGF